MATFRGVQSPKLTGAAALMTCVCAGGCSDTMKLESKLDGELTTVLKVDGPLMLQMQMQGPMIKYEGTYISEELLGHVKVGATTDDWILAVFGKPDAQAELRDGTEIWRWTYRPVEQQGSMVELFTSSEKEPKLATQNVFIRLRAGLVVEKWKG